MNYNFETQLWEKYSPFEYENISSQIQKLGLKPIKNSFYISNNNNLTRIKQDYDPINKRALIRIEIFQDSLPPKTLPKLLQYLKFKKIV